MGAQPRSIELQAKAPWEKACCLSRSSLSRATSCCRPRRAVLEMPEWADSTQDPKTRQVCLFYSKSNLLCFDTWLMFVFHVAGGVSRHQHCDPGGSRCGARQVSGSIGNDGGQDSLIDNDRFSSLCVLHQQRTSLQTLDPYALEKFVLSCSC